MAGFTTRVELHYANAEDYQKLHEAMKKQGFSRTINGDNGITYHLPTAEYLYYGEITASSVVDKAKVAAGSVKNSYEVLVTEAVRWNWYGLKQV
jgi:hypothetical protein